MVHTCAHRSKHLSCALNMNEEGMLRESGESPSEKSARVPRSTMNTRSRQQNRAGYHQLSQGCSQLRRSVPRVLASGCDEWSSFSRLGWSCDVRRILLHSAQRVECSNRDAATHRGEWGERERHSSRDSENVVFVTECGLPGVHPAKTEITEQAC